MKQIKKDGPFDCLTKTDRKNVEAMEKIDGLDFLKAVDVLELDPYSDFRYADLSGISFDGMDLRSYDFTGARMIGCSFMGALLPFNFFGALELFNYSNRYGGSDFVTATVSKKLESVFVRDKVGNFFQFSFDTLSEIGRKPLLGVRYDIGIIPGTDEIFALNSSGDLRVLGGVHMMSIESKRMAKETIAASKRFVSHGQVLAVKDGCQIVAHSVKEPEEKETCTVNSENELFAVTSSAHRKYVAALSISSRLFLWERAASSIRPLDLKDVKKENTLRMSRNGKFILVGFGSGDIGVIDVMRWPEVQSTKRLLGLNNSAVLLSARINDNGDLVVLDDSRSIYSCNILENTGRRRLQIPFSFTCWDVDEDCIVIAGQNGNIITTRLHDFVESDLPPENSFVLV